MIDAELIPKKRNEILHEIRDRFGEKAEMLAFLACEATVAPLRQALRKLHRSGLAVPCAGNVSIVQGEIRFKAFKSDHGR